MHGPRTAPTALSDLPAYTEADSPVFFNPEWPAGSTLKILTLDEGSGASTIIGELTPGYRRKTEVDYLVGHPPGRFERHLCREEIFVLDGTIEFGDWYRLPMLGYCNHPPNWVHPADIRSRDAVTLLIKTSGALDFAFWDIPEEWDRREFIVHPDGTTGEDSLAVTAKLVNTMPWLPALGPDGEPTGFSVKQIWADPRPDWVTWLVEYPPGWQATDLPKAVPGGDELLLLEGDLTVMWDGRLHTLDGPGYYCEPDRFPASGPAQRSTRGARAIRWTMNAPFGV